MKKVDTKVSFLVGTTGFLFFIFVLIYIGVRDTYPDWVGNKEVIVTSLYLTLCAALFMLGTHSAVYSDGNVSRAASAALALSGFVGAFVFVISYSKMLQAQENVLWIVAQAAVFVPISLLVFCIPAALLFIGRCFRK